MKEAKNWFLMLVVAVWGGQAVQATVLDFQTPNGFYTGVDASNYGDNVGSSPQGGYSYGTNYGFTPDVKVSVDDSTTLYVDANSSVYITNISPVRKVLNVQASGATNAMTFTITPLPKYSVTLRSFYVGAYGGGGTPAPSDGFRWLAAYVDGSLAWTAPSSVRSNFPAGGIFLQEGVTAGWTSGLLTGTNTVRLEWVPNGSNAALGNIGFSEVPEPTACALVVAVGFMIAGRRRRA